MGIWWKKRKKNHPLNCLCYSFIKQVFFSTRLPFFMWAKHLQCPLKKRESEWEERQTQRFLWCHSKMAHLNLLAVFSSPLSKAASHKHDTQMNGMRLADAQCFKPTFLTPFAGFLTIIYRPVSTGMEPLLQSQDDFFNHWHILHGLAHSPCPPLCQFGTRFL